MLEEYPLTKYQFDALCDLIAAHARAAAGVAVHQRIPYGELEEAKAIARGLLTGDEE